MSITVLMVGLFIGGYICGGIALLLAETREILNNSRPVNPVIRKIMEEGNLMALAIMFNIAVLPVVFLTFTFWWFVGVLAMPVIVGVRRVLSLF